jgi:putative flippase GtrA
MHQRLPAVLLSAVTGVGGHFLNQRWDRALLFFALFGLLMFLGYAVPFLSFYLNLPGAWVFAAFAAGVLGIGLAWLASLIVTWRDSSPQRLAPPLRWTFSARLGATLSSLLVTGMLAYALMQSSMSLIAAKSIQSAASATGTHDHGPQRRGKSFWQYLALGGQSSSPDALPAPPAGAGLLVGKFVYDGKPAAGVTLTLSLNGKYRATGLTTDAQGRFTLKLAPGEWYLNHVQTESWDERPDEGEFILLSGAEGRLRDNDYDRHPSFRSDGLKVMASETPPAEPLTFTIRRRVLLQWPGKDDRRVEATHKAASIRWQAYPQATDYVVRITRVERIGRGASYIQTATRRVPAKTELALADLRAVPGTASGQEYQVTVAAFAADGSFLSETAANMESHSFTLTDVKMLADDSLASVASAAQMAEAMQNRRRLDAVQVLIEEGLLAEAEKALARVRGATAPGNKEALTGYLRARQGRCAEATKLFDQAVATAGKTCVPESWRTCTRR